MELTTSDRHAIVMALSVAEEAARNSLEVIREITRLDLTRDIIRTESGGRLLELHCEWLNDAAFKHGALAEVLEVAQRKIAEVKYESLDTLIRDLRWCELDDAADVADYFMRNLRRLDRMSLETGAKQ